MNPSFDSQIVTVTRLRCEYKKQPIGLDNVHPRFSWILTSPRRATRQTAYEISVAFSETDLKNKKKLLWTTHKVIPDHSVNVIYRGPKLISRKRYYWRVRIWDESGSVSEWSESSYFEMGILRHSEWQARWIELRSHKDVSKKQPAVYMRTSFTAEKPVASARMYATAHGVYELSINGVPIDESIFAPGWTVYPKYLQYQTYDITLSLRKGETVIGVILGDGWWRGKIGATSIRNVYGKSLALLAEIHILYFDGTEKVIVTDESWRASYGPILQSDFKDGEVYDARLEQEGWDKPGFDACRWQTVSIVNFSKKNLIAQVGFPVQRHETFKPVSIFRTPSGQTVVDMGQNFAGRVRISVRGAAGAAIVLRHGESLDSHGNFSTSHLNLPFFKTQQRVKYILKGSEAEEIFEPHFTYYGFRYVLIEEFPIPPLLEHFTGIALYTALPETGKFTCSNRLLNRLQHNIVWSQKSNFVDIPTDCPHREKAGWTGDAQIFALSSTFNMEVITFFNKWLRDLEEEQSCDGQVPNLVPYPYKRRSLASLFFKMTNGCAGWGDATVIIPWVMYQVYADTELLKHQYPSIKAWVDYMHKEARKTAWYTWMNPRFWIDRKKRKREIFLWDTGFHWGEWFAPSSRKSFGFSTFITIVKHFMFGVPEVATAYLAYSTLLLSYIANELGLSKDAKHYSILAKRVKDAFVSEFVRDSGYIGQDTQDSYVRALYFDLVPRHIKPLAARRLVDLIYANGTHLDTGFLSTGFLLPVLVDMGYLELAYTLLMQESKPSWIFQIKKGATTLWESWNGISEDGVVHASLNHCAFGAVGQFMYDYIAGIKLETLGKRHIHIAPYVGRGLSFVKASYDSLFGRVAVFWKQIDNKIHVNVTIPPNTTASVHLLNAKVGSVRESGLSLSKAEGIYSVRQNGSSTVIEIGSGTFSFEYSFLTV